MGLYFYILFLWSFFDQGKINTKSAGSESDVQTKELMFFILHFFDSAVQLAPILGVVYGCDTADFQLLDSNRRHTAIPWQCLDTGAATASIVMGGIL